MADPAAEELLLQLRARAGLLVLVTVEEQRALTLLGDLAAVRGGDLVSWDIADEFGSAQGRPLPDAAGPSQALTKVRELIAADPDRRDLYVLKDFHEFWTEPRTRRLLRTVAQEVVRTGAGLVVTTPTRDVPAELRDEAVVVELPLPTEATLRTELDRLGTRPGLTPAARDRLARAALGLTTVQARRAFAAAVVRADDRDVEAVLRAKRAAIRESRALEFLPWDQPPVEVGGLDALYQAFTDDRDIETEDVAAAIARMVPLSRSQREVIDRLRFWLHEGRAQPASGR